VALEPETVSEDPVDAASQSTTDTDSGDDNAAM